MVQREVGERLAAPPASRSYGVPSVLCQLACEVRVLRAIARSVFVPVPNVDSVLVGLDAARAGRRRRSCGASSQGAFAHRRKALARSLALSVGADRERVRAALVAIGASRRRARRAARSGGAAALWEAL